MRCEFCDSTNLVVVHETLEKFSIDDDGSVVIGLDTADVSDTEEYVLCESCGKRNDYESEWVEDDVYLFYEKGAYITREDI